MFAVRTGVTLGVCAIASLLCLEAGADTAEWWKAPEMQRELRLTARQIASLDAVFRESLTERRRLRIELDRLEARLVGVMDRGDLDDHFATALIETVEQTRARRNILRSVMLLRMYKILSPEQRAVLRRVSLPDIQVGHGVPR